tara:strand:- start:2205 stop:2933 length:729 start_codon:yes stop_codon:yes gene_type:complete
MSELLPDVVMPESSVKEEVEEVNPDTEEANPNMVYEETDSKEMPDEVVKPEPKTLTPDEEIFKDVKPTQTKKYTKTGRPKRVASQQQKEHLARMRIRAAEVKRKKKEERMAIEEEEMLIKRAERKVKEQHRKAKVKEAEKVLEVKAVKEPEPKPAPKPEVIRPEPVEAPPPLQRQNTISITREELLELQQEAIDKYEVKRKKRKEAKQKEQTQKQKDAKAFEQVSRAIHRPPTEDVWGQCFQ